MSIRKLLVLVITLFSLEAEAATVNLLGRPIEAVIPTGYCEVGSHPADANLVSSTRAGIGNANQILVLFANCMELEDFRNGGRTMLDNYGLILAQTPKGQLRLLKGVSRSEYIKKMGAQPSNNPKNFKKIEARAKQYIPGYKSYENLGLLGTDSNGLYEGLMMTLTDDTGRLRPIVGIIGMTLVKEFSITINLYQAYQNSPDLRGLLTRHQSATANFVRANN